MNTLLIGNIISTVGAVIMIGTGFIKRKNNILLAQCVMFGFMGTGNLVLGGTTGFIANAVGILRNLLCIKWKYTVWMKLAFMAVQIALSASVNNLGLIGWIPVVAVCTYTWMLDTKNEVVLKTVIIVTQLMWCVYDFTICNYASFLCDVFTVISTSIGIVMIKKQRKNS